jgi:hypothetical protein
MACPLEFVDAARAVLRVFRAAAVDAALLKYRGCYFRLANARGVSAE